MQQFYFTTYVLTVNSFYLPKPKPKRLAQYFFILSFICVLLRHVNVGKTFLIIRFIVIKRRMFLKISIESATGNHFKVVPISWVKDLNITKVTNEGLFGLKSQTFTVFFSLDMDAEPEFWRKN